MLMNNALIKEHILKGEYSFLNQKKSSIRIRYGSTNSLFKEDILGGFSKNGDAEFTCSYCNSIFYSSYSGYFYSIYVSTINPLL